MTKAAEEKNIANALESLDLNSEKEVKPTCDFCAKENPTKRCAKRHAKCMRKLFCDKSCEEAAHRSAKKAANAHALTMDQENISEAQSKAAEAEKALKAKKKKAKKASNAEKKKRDGELWWNNSVYASW